MANELTVSVAMRFEKSSVIADIAYGSLQFTVSGSRYIEHVQNVGTSEEALRLPESGATLGWCLLFNMDATNYVEVYTATSGTAFAKLKAGEPAVFRFGSGVTAPFIKANSSACNVRVLIIED